MFKYELDNLEQTVKEELKAVQEVPEVDPLEDTLSSLTHRLPRQMQPLSN